MPALALGLRLDAPSHLASPPPPLPHLQADGALTGPGWACWLQAVQGVGAGGGTSGVPTHWLCGLECSPLPLWPQTRRKSVTS